MIGLVTLRRAGAALVLALVSIASGPRDAAAQIPSPESHFGFRMGTDRELATAEQIEQYFERVAARSDRVKVVDIGPTTEGHRTLAAIVTSPDNIRNLDQIRLANQRLADPRTLSREDALRLAAGQKTILAVGASIHASEIGATQAANELLYTLASANDPATEQILQNVVLILIPMLNPDGHRLVTDWYAKTRGTPLEGGPMPWLYHKYAGHDINRDAFMMNLPENRNLARFFYSEWHPHVFLTMHQMEENGPRFFVPPNTDPIDLNYDPLIWRSAALLGDAMALELQRDHRTGVVSNAKYDYYWPGFEDSAPLGHNTVCLLTEVASANVASPITVSPNDLKAGFKGLPDYKAQINFPEPWPGGRWTLRDIVEYDMTAVRGLLFAASAYRSQIVENFYEMGRRAVDLGRQGGPFAFLIPPEQHDPYSSRKLEELLLQGAVEIQRAAEPFRADGQAYPAGTDIILLAQPYRAYVKTLLERQNYPARRTSAAGPTERPYDVAGWTLSQQMGVKVVTVDRSFDVPATTGISGATIVSESVWGERKPGYWLIDTRGNGGAIAVNRMVAAGATPSWTPTAIEADGFRYPPGSMVVPYVKKAEDAVSGIARDLGLRVDGMKGRVPSGLRPIGRARVALYKPWTENIDEGWTRWVLEQHEFKFASITDQDVRAGDLRQKYDVVILPNASVDRLVAGYPADAIPAEYAGGMTPAGVDALRAFVRGGGTLICLAQSSQLGIAAFNLPIRDVASESEDRLFVPGSILRLELDTARPLGYGMLPQTAAFFTFSSAFEIMQPRSATAGHGGDAGFSANVETVARYGAKDLLLSGWLEGEDVIAGRAAVVDARVGAGHVVLFGFPVQHRGQTLATFRLLFNAIFIAR